jgi:hypothetical protein
MVTDIVAQALETVKFSSFVALRRLYERGFTLDARYVRFLSGCLTAHSIHVM